MSFENIVIDEDYWIPKSKVREAWRKYKSTMHEEWSETIFEKELGLDDEKK